MDRKLHQLSLAFASCFVLVLLFLVDLGLFTNSKKEVAYSPKPIIVLPENN
ncbi:hypothetical protein [Gloeocapsa sp. PCC 73106]|uniref:hypothetical protein n=1 Tax=Gloeocapsa sp. PCC 73106 TaxID=102232 RepID=UPI0002ABF42B|nr:hypothetical protein [Gloeocapsa sp. PCC 73106]ELR97913.1 hypothetical protein GLO73106DRAFT_00017310 [Gloeocapsa sp. PCC 73106]